MSLRLRFALALTTVGLALFAAYAVWAYASEKHDLEIATRTELRIVGQSLQTALSNALRDGQVPDIEEMLVALEAVAADLDVHVYDADGALVARSRGASVDPTIEEMLAKVRAGHGEMLAGLAPQRMVLGSPIVSDDGDLLGVLAIARSTKDIVADLARTRVRLLLALVVFVVASMVAGLLLGTAYVQRPITRLLAGIRLVRAGDFRARARPGGAGEIGDLVSEFNATIDTIAEMRDRVEREGEARARLEAGLQHVDKLATIGQLSAGLAHEIGSPLQVLSGRASVLQDHTDPEVRRQATHIVSQCERITGIVERLLSIARRRPAVVGPCDLVVPVATVIDLMSVEARRRGIQLTLDVACAPCPIVADADQLQQVTLNLVRNALDATAPGGTIGVRIERRSAVPCLVVRDSGRGISEAVRPHLFEPFFTTRAAAGGTGLGLAVVRAIADEHHATIEVHSEPGHGTEFVVRFPHVAQGTP